MSNDETRLTRYPLDDLKRLAKHIEGRLEERPDPRSVNELVAFQCLVIKLEADERLHAFVALIASKLDAVMRDSKLASEELAETKEDLRKVSLELRRRMDEVECSNAILGQTVDALFDQVGRLTDAAGGAAEQLEAGTGEPAT